MTTETQQTSAAPATDAKEQTQPATSAATINTDTEPKEILIPKSRFDEVNAKLKALENAATRKEQEREVEDEKKLAAQAEWQKLADNRKAKVDELTPKAELADKLTALVTEQYAAEIAEWPAQVKAMAPSDDASILVKLEWMKKAKPLAVELMADAPLAHGNGRRPPPVAAAGTGAREKEARGEQQRWTRNQF